MTPAARVLALAAFVTPGICVYAARGSVEIIAIAGVLALIAFVWENRRLPKPPVTPTLLAAATVVLVAISALWSIDPEDTLKTAGKVALVMVAGLLFLTMAVHTTDHERRSLRSFFGLGFVIAVVLLAAESMANGMFIQELRDSHFTAREDVMTSFNMTGGQFALLIWLAVPALPDRWRRIGQWAAVLAVAAVLASLNVATNVAAIAVGAAILYLVSRAPMLTAGAMAAVIIGAFVLAPAFPRWLPSPEVMVAWKPEPPMSIVHRVAIWQFAIDRIAEKPLFGWGAHASRHIGDRYRTKYPEKYRNAARNEQLNAARLAYFQSNILPLHPHNGILQLWLEIGIPGSVLGLVVVLTVLFAAVRSRNRGPHLAMFGALLVLFGMAFGIWQSWWLATMWLLLGLATMTTETGTGDTS